jgi:hypothetical protein
MSFRPPRRIEPESQGFEAILEMADQVCHDVLVLKMAD